MSNRYYQSENCTETINKEFSMAETFWPHKNNNATNSISYDKECLSFENELLEYPLRDVGEKCGEIFILNCSGDVVYSCQFCDDYFINIGKLIHHFYDQHGFQDNRPKERVSEILSKNRIETLFETQKELQNEREETDGDTSNQNVSENYGDNSNQINQAPTQVNLQTSNLPKLIQTPGGQKYLLVSTPVVNNSFTQPQHIHFQQPTQQTFGLVNPQYTSNFTQIPQNQSFLYNSTPIHHGVQTAFVNTPTHNVSNNIVGGTSTETVPEESVQITSFDNLIEFDSGSNSNQSPSNALHKDVGNTIEEIVANYPDEDNVLPPTTGEQFVIATEETSNQCAQTFQDQESGNPEIINGNKIEALIEELVNSNSNSQHNYMSENENNQTPIVLSGNHSQTLYVQNHPTFFATGVQNNQDPNLTNQHIITHQNQPVLLNNEGVQQNYIFDGQHLQAANFVNASNSQNQTSNLYIKFNENDGNIYLLNGFNNNLNINGMIDSNPIQISTQNDVVNETVSNDEINMGEVEIGENSKIITKNNNLTSCEPMIDSYLNDPTQPQRLLENNSPNLINNEYITINNQTIGTENIDLSNIHMQHVSAEEIVAGSSSQMHEQEIGLMQSDSEMNLQNEDHSQDPILQMSNDVNAMDIMESETISRQNIEEELTPKELFPTKKNEPKFLENFQKFLEDKRDDFSVGAKLDEDEAVEENEAGIGKEIHNSKAKNHEASNKNFSCKICGRLFKEDYHLKAHNTKSDIIKCGECNLSFCNSKIFAKHKKTHTSEAPVIKCDLCSLTFRSQHFLEMHMKNHNDVRPFKCSICRSSFRLQRCLDLHMNRHFGKKPYACNFCEKCYFTGTERSQHEIVYHTGKGCTFKCKDCNKEFMQRSNLVSHMKVSHNNDNKKKESTVISTGAIECKICKMKFETTEMLQEHTNNIHTVDNIANSSNALNKGNKVLVENYNHNNDRISININSNLINDNSNNNIDVQRNIDNNYINNLDLGQINSINISINNSNNNNDNNNNGNKNNNDSTLVNNNSNTTETMIESIQYLICQYCENKFLNSDLLNEHIIYCSSSVSKNNLIDNNNKCIKCNIILKNSNELTNHLNRHCIEEEIDVVL